MKILKCFGALTLGVASLMMAHSAMAIVPAAPQVEGRAYTLVEFQSGSVLAGSQADARMEPASLTKVMTVYVLLQEMKAGKIGLNDNVHISENAWSKEGSRTFVTVGNTVPLEVLLKGMVVQSGNDATVALAEHVAGSEEVFAQMMNQTAAKLGMKSSHFMNSTGLPDPNHYTTANDMAKLTRALIRDFPEHYAWYSIKEFTHNGITQKNRNKLLFIDPTVDGVKTGHTESAGFCLISSAKRSGMRLISVVMGTASEDARAVESQKVLGYGFRFYESRSLYKAGQTIKQAKVWKGSQDNVALGLALPLDLVLPRGEAKDLKVSIKVNPELQAPLAKGQAYGSLDVLLNGKVISQRKLIALQDVPEAGFFGRMVDTVKLWLE